MIFTIIAIILILTVFPYIGKQIYKSNERKIFSFYFSGIGVLFAINMIFSDINLSNAGNIISAFVEQVFSQNFFFFSMLLFFYVFGGIGFFGSLAEKSCEMIEDFNLFSELKRRIKVKTYFLYLIYGYLYIFGIVSANKILSLLLGLEYKEGFSGIGDFFITLGFGDFFYTYIMIIGISLYNLKAFKYGYFSKEFWRSGLTLKEKEITWLRFIRKIVVIFIFVWAVYLCVIISFIEMFADLNDIFGEFGPFALYLIFYISSFFESVFFYRNRNKLVDPLKFRNKDYKKKIDEKIKIKDKNKDIKF